MQRASSIDQLLKKRRKVLGVDPELWRSFGYPELDARLFIMAPSGSGKTTFCSMLAKKLSQYGRFLYNSAEEGDSESLKMAFNRVNMKEVRGKVVITSFTEVEPLIAYLDKHKSPMIVLIDSIQFTDLTKDSYKTLVQRYRGKKMFIFVSHMDGKKPDGATAIHARRDAGVKIRVEGYVAFVETCRYGGELKAIVIWEEGAKRYWGTEYDSIINNTQNSYDNK